jgi:hypothetical protein
VLTAKIIILVEPPKHLSRPFGGSAHWQTGTEGLKATPEPAGYCFEPDEVDVVSVIMALADGTADEGTLAPWFSDYSKPKKA